MKFTLQLLLIATLSVSTIAGDWQTMMSDADVRYEEIKAAFDGYWSKRPTEGRRPGHKQFERWRYFAEQRLSEDGRFNHTAELWQAWLNSEARRKHMKRADFEGNWVSLGPVGGPNGKDIGRVNGVFADPVDPQTLYLCTPAAGIWKTTDGGQVWLPMTAGMPTFGSNGLVIDPRDTRVVHAITGDPNSSNTQSVGMLKSEDGGLTWNRTVLDGVTMMYDIEMHRDNHDIIWVATNRGLYKTLDAGASWQAAFPADRGNPYFRDIAVKPNDPNVMYGITMSAALWRSTDGGLNWSEQVALSGGRSSIAVSPADPERVYALVSNGNSLKGFYRSDDAGSTYQLMADKPNLFARFNGGNDGQAWYDQAITVDPQDADVIYVGGIKIWKSVNGGSDWLYLGTSESNPRYVHDDIHYMGIHHGVLYVGCDGGVYRSDDAGETFNHLNDSLNIMQFYRLGTSQKDVSHFLGGSQDNGTSLHDSAGWKKINGADGMECAVDPFVDSIVYFSTQNGPLYRRDLATGSGRSITPREDSGASLRGPWVTPYVLDPSQEGVMYAGYSDVYKSTDRGDTWTKISDLRAGYLEYVVVSSADNQVLYAGSSGSDQFFRSADGGATWSTIRFAPAGDTRYAIHNLLADHADPRKLWIVVRPSPATVDGRVFRSDDAGATWTNITGTLPQVKANCLVQDVGGDERIYVGTDLGVYYREPGFDDWIAFNQGMPPVIINEMEIQYAAKRLRVATFSRGMWDSELFSASKEAPLAEFVTRQEPNCDGMVVRYRDLSTGLPTNRTWLFPGGSPASSTDAEPVVTYSEPGVYDVTLRVSNAFGSAEKIAEDYVGVPGLPVSGAFADDFNGLTESDAGIQLGQWINQRDDKADWLPATQVISDGSGTWTGPESDAGGDGTFLYLPDVTRAGGMDAALMSPCIDLSGMANPRLTFMHYLRGAVTTEISVDVFADGIWHRGVGAKAQARWAANSWKKHIIELSEFRGKQVRLMLRGSVSQMNNNRCAIDDVQVIDDNSPIAPVIERIEMPAEVQVDSQFEARVIANDPNGLELTYRWTVGDDLQFVGESLFHTFERAGTYNVRVIATNTLGASSELTTTVTASGEPNQTPQITSVSVDPQRPLIGQQVTLSATAVDPDGDTLEYTWRSGFGPGRGVVGQTVQFTFNQSGRQRVWLNVNDGRNRGWASQEVLVDVLDNDGSERLWHNETREAIALDAGETRLYKVEPVDNWTSLQFAAVNDAANVSLYLKAGAIPTTGDYDMAGVLNRDEKTIDVGVPGQQNYYVLLVADRAVTGLDFTVKTEMAEYIFPGQTRDRLDVERGSYRYFFVDAQDYGDLVFETNRGEGDLDLYVAEGYLPTTDRNDAKSEGSTGEERISLSNTAGKKYLIGLYGYEDVRGTSLQVSGTRLDNQAPVIEDWSVPTTGKVGETLTFTANVTDADGDALQILWTSGDGRQAEGPSVSFSYERVGQFIVNLEVRDTKGGRDYRTATLNITESENRVPVISSLVLPRFGTVGEAATLNVNATDADGDTLTYTWDLGDGNSATGNPVNHTYASDGSFFVTVTVEDGRGGRAEERGTILIQPAVNRVPVITALTVPEQGFVGEVTEFSVAAEDADGDSLSTTWTMGDGTTLEGTVAAHTYAAPGSYTVNVAVNDGKGGVATREAVIEIVENQGVPSVAVDSTLFGLTESTGGEMVLRVAVPADVNALRLVAMGGSGDADLYVKLGEAPSRTDFQFRSWESGNREVIDLSGVAGQTVYVMLHAYTGFDGLMFGVNSSPTYTVRQAGTVSGLWGSNNAARYFRIVAPANANRLQISVNGPNGDCDLYLAEGREPTLQSYDAVSANSGSSDALSVENAAGKTYILMQYGYRAYTDVTLSIQFD
ncbi:PKD domain-containing protein [Acanthopleuribacter pedis]|uniref:PKD domain-containing protein n=1 Tax=Acanthopleuribacter pedis TaxID=442870 RepID=A0A8J7QJZ3_9BACT|nr:PKD domain-containing protein [Acanthopleuribacter pedis]MBO1319600.1 PKD domain-containing protein [Acanthopleuribacter pedis]